MMGVAKEQLREHLKVNVGILFINFFTLSWALATVWFVHKVQHFLSSDKERHIVSQWMQIN